MARFAVVDDGVVVGVLAAPTAPVLDIPPNRVFVDITDGPDVRGGESYDPKTGVFILPLVPLDLSLRDRVAALELKTDAIQSKLPTVEILPLPPTG
jgi:hypothetical protein